MHIETQWIVETNVRESYCINIHVEAAAGMRVCIIRFFQTENYKVLIYCDDSRRGWKINKSIDGRLITRSLDSNDPG